MDTATSTLHIILHYNSYSGLNETDCYFGFTILLCKKKGNICINSTIMSLYSLEAIYE